jgi:hypothetical protein
MWGDLNTLERAALTETLATLTNVKDFFVKVVAVLVIVYFATSIMPIGGLIALVGGGLIIGKEWNTFRARISLIKTKYKVP